MSTANFSRPHDYNVICDRTGFKCRRSQCVIEEKTGYLVLKGHEDKRNPQDFVVAIKDRQTVPIARPEPPDKYWYQ